MNIDDKLLYLIKIYLSVDYLNDSPQGSYFSTECTLNLKQRKSHFSEVEVKDFRYGKKNNAIPSVNEVFICWFILQHLRGYVPFITKITFEEKCFIYER